MRTEGEELDRKGMNNINEILRGFKVNMIIIVCAVGEPNLIILISLQSLFKVVRSIRNRNAIESGNIIGVFIQIISGRLGPEIRRIPDEE